MVTMFPAWPSVIPVPRAIWGKSPIGMSSLVTSAKPPTLREPIATHDAG
jgi:hypothetical protein